MTDENEKMDQEPQNVTADVETAADEAPEIELSEEELKALCREQICSNCDIGKEAEDIRLRALAESENVKKRLMRETEELRKYAGETILASLLPVMDNLDLALNHASGLDACKDFIVGVDMTRKIFLETLERHGLTATGNAGEEFDPAIHEALGMATDENLANNTVAQLVQKGYMLKGRLLRPAKVMVNKLS
ncbi:MAG: nucleotide exchange factor GrpE [Proteobacteria bacterium]|nr:nucleotide exchange factor GrpE [Pseudomonadota bacterium]